jgi:hypothetical protein
MKLSTILQNVIMESTNISSIINDLVAEYIKTNHGRQLHGGTVAQCASPYDINNGYCVEFAEDLIERLGGENDNQFILSSDMFCNYDAIGIWPVEDVIETNHESGWSKRMLQMYGQPPIDYDIRLIDDLPHHQWCCIHGKHYDAECPEGVATPWKLTIFKKFFINFKEEFIK